MAGCFASVLRRLGLARTYKACHAMLMIIANNFASTSNNNVYT
jgi:hypothetical protein